MNKQIFFDMNVAFEKQIYLLRQSLPSSKCPADRVYVRNWVVCKHVVRSPELSQF